MDIIVTIIVILILAILLKLGIKAILWLIGFILENIIYIGLVALIIYLII